jgi:hypothetical protein
MMGKQVKVGVHEGGGPPPGYQWTVLILSVAHEEARGFLSEDQYRHAAMQVKELATEADPTHPLTASVDAIEDFHELRDKGGILVGINLRVFFLLDKEKSALVVIGAIKKQNDGPTPKGDRLRMARRKRKYFNGDYG